jgi:hypothetical protein
LSSTSSGRGWDTSRTLGDEDGEDDDDDDGDDHDDDDDKEEEEEEEKMMLMLVVVVMVTMIRTGLAWSRRRTASAREKGQRVTGYVCAGRRSVRWTRSVGRRRRGGGCTRSTSAPRPSARRRVRW